MAGDVSGAPVRVVMVTVPDAEVGRALARSVVEAGLAACGSVVPGVTSVYRWKGEVLEDPEALLLLKTTEEAVPELMERIVDEHPYDVPEFLALPVAEGYPAYLRWVAGVEEGGA